MSLVYCEKCGGQISDRAERCPHCGETAENNKSRAFDIMCEDCGTKYESGLKKCPTCGCPSPKRGTFLKRLSNNKIAIAVIALAFLALIIGGVIINNRSNNKNTDDKSQNAVGIMSEKSSVSQYYKNLEKVALKMLDGAAVAEESGNLTKSVWYNTIYQEDDEETDKYTKKNGRFFEDFNDALSALFESEEFQDKKSEILDNQEEVNKIMKKIVSPPEECKEAHAALKTYYDCYLEFTDLVVNPSGSLNTFSDRFDALDTATVNAYKKIKLYFKD